MRPSERVVPNNVSLGEVVTSYEMNFCKKICHLFSAAFLLRGKCGSVMVKAKKMFPDLAEGLIASSVQLIGADKQKHA